jgi:uncharacterized protein YndB with AHSA1/START domain
MGVDRQVRHLSASADAVWTVVGDPTALPLWFPSVKTCRLEGDQRICELHSGAVITERVLECDSQRRLLRYQISTGLSVASHLGTVEVTEDGPDGCAVTYTTELEPDDLLPGLARSVATALGRLTELYR